MKMAVSNIFVKFITRFLVFFIPACNSNYTAGKKKGYFKIEFPEKSYKVFDLPDYPYTFEYPVYASVMKDTAFFNEKAGDYWINIDIPQFGGRIHISYKPIMSRKNFDSLVQDGYKMAYKQHQEISTGIDDSVMKTPHNVEGIYFSLHGNTATANQFFLTDSTKHFLRGALYFEATPNEDSIGIVNNFIRQDLMHLINSFDWKPVRTGGK
jgi:gliding motility-associated lipoprotein GldD